MKQNKDLTGLQFGRLTVLSRASPEVKYDSKGQKRTRQRWNCICQCGNYCVVKQDGLICQHTKSCGCLKQEQSSLVHRKFNKYEIVGNYVKGFDNKNNMFLIDKEDIDIIKSHSFYLGKNGYFYTRIINKDGNKLVPLHSLILTAPNGLVIDHINRDKSDNRKQNLRIVTRQQNNINSNKRIDNSTGIIGVSKRSDGYTASIGKKYLGFSTNIETVIKLRLEAEAKIFGEFAPQKELFEKYNIKMEE